MAFIKKQLIQMRSLVGDTLGIRFAGHEKNIRQIPAVFFLAVAVGFYDKK